MDEIRHVSLHHQCILECQIWPWSASGWIWMPQSWKFLKYVVEVWITISHSHLCYRASQIRAFQPRPGRCRHAFVWQRIKGALLCNTVVVARQSEAKISYDGNHKIPKQCICVCKLQTQDTSDPGHYGTSLVSLNCPDRSTLVPKCPAHPQRGTAPPIFGPCLLWPNGRRSQLLLSTCYGRPA